MATPDPQGARVRDRLWLWAHAPGVYGTAFGLPGPSRLTPVEAATFLGIPNLLMVRYGGAPRPPYAPVAHTLRPLRRLVWSVDGTPDAAADRTAVVRLAAAFPAIEGVILDDFFAAPEAASATPAVTVAALQALRRQLTVGPRRLDLWVVLYTHQLTPAVVPFLALCDVVTLWTWHAADLAHLAAHFRALERLAPATRKVLGCYLWDFGAHRPLPPEAMARQCALGRAWLRTGRIEGLIFLGSPLCDLGLASVAWTRAWIARVGDAPVGG